MGLDSNQTSNRTQFTHNNPIKTSLPPYDFDLLMKIVYGLLLLLGYTFQLFCFLNIFF